MPFCTLNNVGQISAILSLNKLFLFEKIKSLNNEAGNSFDSFHDFLSMFIASSSLELWWGASITDEQDKQ